MESVIKCNYCGAQLGEERRDVQINGVIYHFCSTKYRFIAKNCITKFLDNHKTVIRQFRTVSLAR